MSFTHACFLSYRHPHHEAGEQIVRSFHDVLQGQVDLYMPGWTVYLDVDRLQPGYLFNESLASQLCASACMVVLFNPSYFDREHQYCAREYKAMVALEQRRLALLPGDDRAGGLIIPVILRGEEDLPIELKHHRQYVSLESEILGASDLKDRSCVKKISAIAKAVYRRRRALERAGEPCTGCEAFRLPTEGEIQGWLQAMLAPAQPQPGR